MFFKFIIEIKLLKKEINKTQKKNLFIKKYSIRLFNHFRKLFITKNKERILNNSVNVPS